MKVKSKVISDRDCQNVKLKVKDTWDMQDGRDGGVKQRTTDKRRGDDSDSDDGAKYKNRSKRSTDVDWKERHVSPQTDVVCRSWLRSGYCPSGGKCKFSHPADSTKDRVAENPDSSKSRYDASSRHKHRVENDAGKSRMRDVNADSYDGGGSPGSSAKMDRHKIKNVRNADHESSRLRSQVVITRHTSPHSASEECEHREHERERSRRERDVKAYEYQDRLSDSKDNHVQKERDNWHADREVTRRHSDKLRRTRETDMNKRDKGEGLGSRETTNQNNMFDYDHRDQLTAGDRGVDHEGPRTKEGHSFDGKARIKINEWDESGKDRTMGDAPKANREGTAETTAEKRNQRTAQDPSEKPQQEEEEEEEEGEWSLDCEEELALERKRLQLQLELQKIELEKQKMKKVASSASSTSTSSSSSSGSSSSSSSDSEEGEDSSSTDSSSSTSQRKQLGHRNSGVGRPGRLSKSQRIKNSDLSGATSKQSYRSRAAGSAVSTSIAGVSDHSSQLENSSGAPLEHRRRGDYGHPDGGNRDSTASRQRSRSGVRDSSLHDRISGHEYDRSNRNSGHIEQPSSDKSALEHRGERGSGALRSNRHHHKSHLAGSQDRTRSGETGRRVHEATHKQLRGGIQRRDDKDERREIESHYSESHGRNREQLSTGEGSRSRLTHKDRGYSGHTREQLSSGASGHRLPRNSTSNRNTLRRSHENERSDRSHDLPGDDRRRDRHALDQGRESLGSQNLLGHDDHIRSDMVREHRDKGHRHSRTHLDGRSGNRKLPGQRGSSLEPHSTEGIPPLMSAKLLPPLLPEDRRERLERLAGYKVVPTSSTSRKDWSPRPSSGSEHSREADLCDPWDRRSRDHRDQFHKELHEHNCRERDRLFADRSDRELSLDRECSLLDREHGMLGSDHERSLLRRDRERAALREREQRLLKAERELGLHNEGNSLKRERNLMQLERELLSREERNLLPPEELPFLPRERDHLRERDRDLLDLERDRDIRGLRDTFRESLLREPWEQHPEDDDLWHSPSALRDDTSLLDRKWRRTRRDNDEWFEEDEFREPWERERTHDREWGRIRDMDLDRNRERVSHMSRDFRGVLVPEPDLDTHERFPRKRTFGEMDGMLDASEKRLRAISPGLPPADRSTHSLRSSRLPTDEEHCLWVHPRDQESHSNLHPSDGHHRGGSSSSFTKLTGSAAPEKRHRYSKGTLEEGQIDGHPNDWNEEDAAPSVKEGSYTEPEHGPPKPAPHKQGSTTGAADEIPHSEPDQKVKDSIDSTVDAPKDAEAAAEPQRPSARVGEDVPSTSASSEGPPHSQGGTVTQPKSLLATNASLAQQGNQPSPSTTSATWSSADSVPSAESAASPSAVEPTAFKADSESREGDFKCNVDEDETSRDYDPISDEELDGEDDGRKVVDALEVDWASLVEESRKKKLAQQPVSARHRFSKNAFFSRVGISMKLARPEILNLVDKVCYEDAHADINPDEKSESEGPSEGGSSQDSEFGSQGDAKVDETDEQEDDDPYRTKAEKKEVMNMLECHNEDQMAKQVARKQHKIAGYKVDRRALPALAVLHEQWLQRLKNRSIVEYMRGPALGLYDDLKYRCTLLDLDYNKELEKIININL